VTLQTTEVIVKGSVGKCRAVLQQMTLQASQLSLATNPV